MNLNVKVDPEWRDYWRDAFESVVFGVDDDFLIDDRGGACGIGDSFDAFGGVDFADSLKTIMLDKKTIS
jgi:hypothetical protein